MSRKRELRQKNRKPARNRGMFLVAGAVALAVVAVSLLIFANTTPLAGEFTTGQAQDWPMEDGKALGAADAPVIVREFSDFQCPYCRQFHNNIQDQLIADYVASGKVRFEYHHFIVIDGNVGGNESRRSAQASECAADQGRFWDYQNMLFANQIGEGVGSFSDVRLKAFAEALRLDTQKFSSCFDSRQFAGEVSKDEALARSLKVTGTPALFVNDQRIENPLDYASVKAVIDAAIASTNQ